MTDNNDRTLNPPSNTELPFFAYGIFKPGQLAYSKIKNYVDNTINAEINYEMRNRDGVPILVNGKLNNHHTEGIIITFKENLKETAYNIISTTLLKKLYEWETIEIDGEKVNILFGVNPDNGSSHIESRSERVNFDGKNDPFFSEAIELIEKNLNSNRNSHKIENFFELQMNYMLLWSSIERYSSLKYNKRKKIWNYERFANEKSFKEGIKKYPIPIHRPVYSTEDLKIHEFNPDEPYSTLLYYYTLRCNVVHRGKAIYGDYSMLKIAARELLEIFKDILENSFNNI